MKAEKILQEAHKLDIDQRTLLAHKIWRTVEDEMDAEPISAALKKELDRRLAELRKNPETGITWEELRTELKARRRARKRKERA